MKFGISLFGVATILSLMLAACGGGGSGGNTQTPPVVDSFNWTGNTRLTVFAAQGLLANDPAGTAIAAADTVTGQGGTVAVDLATGAFVYDPPVGLQNSDDTFTYTVTGFPPVTVTVSLAERIWYVRNDTTGGDLGTLMDPFATLAQAETAADNNDTIFVYATALGDTGQDLGITLQDGQKLLGEGVGLQINGFPVVDAFPNATISNLGLGGAAGDTPVVMLNGSTNNEVAGFTIMADFNEGVLALGGNGHDIHDNTIVCDASNGREGVRLLNVSGSNRVFGNTVTASPRDGIKVANNEDQAGNPVAATPVTGILDISNNTISSPLQDGIGIDLDGTGTDVALHLLTNTVTSPGTGPGDEGINLNALGAATVSAVLSRNTISGSTDEGIDLQADGTASLAAFVANSDLSGNAGTTDFLSAVNAGSSAGTCLEIRNNVNGAGNSTFSVENNPTNAGAVELFDGGDNDTPVARVGTVTDVAQNACGVALNGGMLFEASCGVCHVGNGLGEGNVGPNLTNVTTAMINFQLTFNPTMSSIALTPGEISAIAAALSTVP